MSRRHLCLLVMSLCSMLACSSTPSGGGGGGGGGGNATEVLIFTNTNVSGVFGGPTAATTFTLPQAATITRIRTYHWNDGEGTTSLGTISLQSADGTSLGSWAVTGAEGQGGAANAYWDAGLSLVLAAGTYTIVDSDNATWSYNAESGGAGIAWVHGIETGGSDDSDDADLVAIAKRHNTVTFYLLADHNYSYDDETTPQDDSPIQITSTYGSALSGVWGDKFVAPITWNGNTFTVDHQNTVTSSLGVVWTKDIQMTGTLSADGRSITSWEGLDITTDDSAITSVSTVRTYLVGSRLPVPYREPTGTDPDPSVNLVYEVTGADVQDYIETVEESDEGVWTYTGTDYDATDDFWIMFHTED